MASAVRRAASEPARVWRRATAARRPWPDFVILGTQRGGTTSLYQWLGAQPRVAPASRKEVHYFDLNYARGERWYRSHFPLRRPGRITGEASPYLLFHPLAPARAARDLPPATRFVVLLRDPVERALSHYFHERRMKAETEPLAAALALEEQRLSGEWERVLAGQRSFGHFHYSYAARGRYAEQLERWFAQVGRGRVLVVESERMFTDPGTRATVTGWLGLPDSCEAFPAVNEASRFEAVEPETRESLERSFTPHNEVLFDLLGSRLWGR